MHRRISLTRCPASTSLLLLLLRLPPLVHLRGQTCSALRPRLARPYLRSSAPHWPSSACRRASPTPKRRRSRRKTRHARPRSGQVITTSIKPTVYTTGDQVLTWTPSTPPTPTPTFSAGRILKVAECASSFPTTLARDAAVLTLIRLSCVAQTSRPSRLERQAWPRPGERPCRRHARACNSGPRRWRLRSG
ncbi:hypothetical protein DMC30DRAFT_271984 [Rhodotorula diobovata]|uniref:Secreted protein n=1 Tax=Rhodotorula diobovata TaxID=5288 RepID=A0A5C5FTI2_9BASI|nr:hypothetical protein DMC30DRAFT_271984 [Rhodotorula diobovata]